jgi:ABC-2 type transport system ATP-binding protein
MKAPVPAIAVSDLFKSFGHFQAVKGISFEVAPGEIVGFLGPNGAGKTTTIKMITGLLKITSGQVLISGLDNRKYLAVIKKKLGYMSQKFSLYPLLTAKENIEFFGGISGLAPRELKMRMDLMAEQVARDVLLQKIQDVPPGIRQKVALFVCLLPEPEIILLDEPTSGVDPEARRHFWNDIYGLKKRGKTLLVSTHNLDEAEYCDRIIIIHNGEIVACGEPDELLRQKQKANIEELFQDAIKSHGQN